MMSNEVSKGIDEIEARFLYDATKATVALFYLIQGMEIASRLYGGSTDDEEGRTIAGPCLAHLKTFPSVSTVGEDMLGPAGEATQLAFKAWVADVYDKWEKSRYRTREFIGDEGIPVEVDCMGDFRLIRNDLIHSGYGTEGKSGKCKVLKWFRPSEKIVFTTDHVFDLLNQLNLIVGPDPISVSNGQTCAWRLVPDAAKPTTSGDYPRLISTRLDVDEDGKEGSQRYMVSCIFADGVFGQGVVEVPVSEERYLEGTIDKDGNISFPGGHVLSGGKLYDACYEFLMGDVRDGPGIWGPRARYARESSPE